MKHRTRAIRRTRAAFAVPMVLIPALLVGGCGGGGNGPVTPMSGGTPTPTSSSPTGTPTPTATSAGQAKVLAANAVLMHFLAIAAYFLDGLAFAAEALVGKAVGAADRAGQSHDLRFHRK